MDLKVILCSEKYWKHKEGSLIINTASFYLYYSLKGYFKKDKYQGISHLASSITWEQEAEPAKPLGINDGRLWVNLYCYTCFI